MSTSGRVVADQEPVRVAVEVGIILQETFREKLSWGARSARRDSRGDSRWDSGSDSRRGVADTTRECCHVRR